jgi:ATP-binding cassette subfamily B protein
MQILKQYLRKYWKMCVLVIVLATINQIFSLVEPMIYQRIIDNYALRFSELTRAELFVIKAPNAR